MIRSGMQLKAKTILKTSYKLCAACKEANFCTDHIVFVDLVLRSEEEVPHILRPLAKRILDCCCLFVIQSTIH